MSTPEQAHRIELRLRDVNQLFNTMDPSPFHEKDLDHDAEEYIESSAAEVPAGRLLELVVKLLEWPQEGDPQGLVSRAVRHYFAYRARMKEREFRLLMRDGLWSLFVGSVFLLACLFASEAIGEVGKGTFLSFLQEGLLIGGWVAMWRPLEIYLYEWWPLRRHIRIYRKLARMPVRVLRDSPENRGP